MPYQLPQGWEWVRLGEITEYNGRKNISGDEIAPDTWLLDLEDIEKGTSHILNRATFSERKSKLLTDNRIHAEMGGLPVFALFDFDKAYDQWNGLNGTVSETKPLNGMIKKWAEGESYALMLPVPANADIQKQVIRNAATGETFGGDSCCEIEHLFYGLDATKNYYQQEPCVGGTKIVFKSDGEKTAFAKEVEPTLDPACFEVFRPMFEFIKSKCPAAAEGEEVAP